MPKARLLSVDEDGGVYFNPQASNYYKCLVDATSCSDSVPGIPDFGGAPTKRLKLKASANVPFDSNGHARLIITPEVDQVVMATTSSSGNYSGPKFIRVGGGTGNSLQYYHADGTLRDVEGGSAMHHSSKAKFSGTAGCGLPPIRLTSGDNMLNATYITADDPSGYYSNDSSNYLAVSCTAGDTFELFIETANSTANNIVPYIITRVLGELIKTVGSAVTGPVTDLNTATSTITIPTNSDYLLEYGVQAGGTSMSIASISGRVVLATSDQYEVLTDFSSDLSGYYDAGQLRYRPVCSLNHFQWHAGNLYGGDIVAAPSYEGADVVHDEKYSVGNLIKRVDSYSGPANAGAMCRYFPLGDNSFKYRQLERNSTRSGLPNKNFSDLTYVFDIDVPDAGGRQMKIVTTLIVEILTTDRIHTPSFVLCNPIELAESMNALRRLSPIHENSMHLEFFKKALKKYALPAGNILAAATSAMFPQFSPAIGAASSLAQHIAGRKPTAAELALAKQLVSQESKNSKKSKQQQRLPRKRK